MVIGHVDDVVVPSVGGESSPSVAYSGVLVKQLVVLRGLLCCLKGRSSSGDWCRANRCCQVPCVARHRVAGTLVHWLLWSMV